MSIELSEMVRRIDPKNTVLFFGAGSSIPSGAPSVNDLINSLCKSHGIDSNDYSLSEVASLIEEKDTRESLIVSLRRKISRLTPTGSLVNLPLYDWKAIYTTNYDKLIELTYEHHGIDLPVIKSNFDFKLSKTPDSTKLYKLHGSIENDYSEGHASRIVISQSDYDNTLEYREHMYNSLEQILSGANLLIIGYSLADLHIRQIVDQSLKINNKSLNPATINLLLYSTDENRAKLFEKRGIRVAFGNLDDLFFEFAQQTIPTTSTSIENSSPLDVSSTLHVVTYDTKHELENVPKNAGAMFQGWPATYSDINSDLTFERTLTTKIVKQIELNDSICNIILGASGTGKSTLSRQVLTNLLTKSYYCWEHKSDYSVPYKDWRKVAQSLSDNDEKGILFVDDAHRHLNELNNLIDLLISDKLDSLKLIVSSARNHWNPRVKSANFYKHGKQYILRKLDNQEIDKLLKLVDSSNDLQLLIAGSFQGFSRSERKRRLTVKCESDTFVCLKNIFASEKFDDIILREYAELDEELREIYKLVAILESSGVKVHRQLIIRLLGIAGEDISSSLTRLVEIIHEYEVSRREGIYGWKGRHPVIMGIISKYKMTDDNEMRKLLENVIDNLVPTYDIEIRTIRQLCAFDSGISMFPDKHIRNILLRKMISVAPAERIPRHRLIRNLIDINEFEKAEIEIRLFENDFGLDNPVRRYRVILKLARANNTRGILEEDRLAILNEARKEASILVSNNPYNKDVLRTYRDVGVDIYKRTGDTTVYYDALGYMKEAEENVGDPDLTQLIIRSERLFSAIEIADDEILVD